jgi:hypothetical protein
VRFSCKITLVAASQLRMDVTKCTVGARNLERNLRMSKVNLCLEFVGDVSSVLETP